MSRLDPVRGAWGTWLLYVVILMSSAGFAMVVSKPCVVLTDACMAPGIQLLGAFGCYGLVRAVVTRDVFSSNFAWNKRRIALVVVLVACFTLAHWAQAELYLRTEAASVGALKRSCIPITTVLSAIFLHNQPYFPTAFVGSLLVFTGALCIGYAS